MHSWIEEADPVSVDDDCESTTCLCPPTCRGNRGYCAFINLYLAAVNFAALVG